MAVPPETSEYTRARHFLSAYWKAGLRFLPFIWKGRKQKKNLYPVEFFEKDSAADLTGANNPACPVGGHHRTALLNSLRSKRIVQASMRSTKDKALYAGFTKELKLRFEHDNKRILELSTHITLKSYLTGVNPVK